MFTNDYFDFINIYTWQQLFWLGRAFEHKKGSAFSYSLFFSIAQKLEPNSKHQDKALQYGRCGLVRRKKHMQHTKEKIDYTGSHFFWLNRSATPVWQNGVIALE